VTRTGPRYTSRETSCLSWEKSMNDRAASGTATVNPTQVKNDASKMAQASRSGFFLIRILP
jgi:hypothetical protein